MNHRAGPINERYMYVAPRRKREYVHWIYSSVVPKVPLVRELARIVVDYVAMTENMHFEAVVLVRPRILSWVWQMNEVLNAGDTYTRWHDEWRSDVIVNDELTMWFNTKMKEMNNHARNCAWFVDYKLYREVSIADMYKLNARTIMSPNWPVGEHRLRISRHDKPTPMIE